MNLSTFTRKQEVSGAVKVKDVADLAALKKTYVPKITHEQPSYPPAIPAAQLTHQMVYDESNFSKEPESFVVNGTVLESENLAESILNKLLPAVVNLFSLLKLQGPQAWRLMEVMKAKLIPRLLINK